MSDVPSAPLPSIRRAQAIDDLRRAFLVRFADPYSTPSILTNVLFENAKHATQPEDGLTRAELLDRANAYLERVTDGLRTIAEDELTRDIPRIAKRVREFAPYLPLYRYGVRSMSGPTHEARGDSIRRLWLRIDLTEATRAFDVSTPETTGMRELDHMHADLVVELVAAFTARYVDQYHYMFNAQKPATKIFYELLHICARESRHRRGIAAITASNIELNTLWQSISGSSAATPQINVGAELEAFARRMRGDEPWIRRRPVPSDSRLFFDAELRWSYTQAHGGRFELQWRFWHVFNDKRGAELTTADDLQVARSIAQIPLVQPVDAPGGTDTPDDDPVLTSLAQAMVTWMTERKDSRTILFLHALEELKIKFVALVRRKRDVRESERTADLVVLRQHNEVVLGVAASEMTVTDGALARTVLGGSIAPAQERHEPGIRLVDDDELGGSDDERERAIAYFKAVDKIGGAVSACFWITCSPPLHWTHSSRRQTSFARLYVPPLRMPAMNSLQSASLRRQWRSSLHGIWRLLTSGALKMPMPTWVVRNRTLKCFAVRDWNASVFPTCSSAGLPVSLRRLLASPELRRLQRQVALSYVSCAKRTRSSFHWRDLLRETCASSLAFSSAIGRHPSRHAETRHIVATVPL